MPTGTETEGLNDLILKLKRLEAALGPKIDRFVESEQALSDLKKELTLEVEELKLLKSSLPKVVGPSIKENIHKEISKMLPSLIDNFKGDTVDLVGSSVKEVERLKAEVNKSVSEAQKALVSGRTVVTSRIAGMTAAFCIASLMTAFGIFYFFPQHVHYGLNTEAAEYMAFGLAYAENYQNLSQQDRELILKKASERLRNRRF